jgi:hypothetical protein
VARALFLRKNELFALNLLHTAVGVPQGIVAKKDHMDSPSAWSVALGNEVVSLF